MRRFDSPPARDQVAHDANGRAWDLSSKWSPDMMKQWGAPWGTMPAWSEMCSNEDIKVIIA